MPIMNKMKTVDLGTLNFDEPIVVCGHKLFLASPYGMMQSNNIKCKSYTAISYKDRTTVQNNQMYTTPTRKIYFANDSYTTAASFKAAMSGVMLTYETVDTVEECIAGLKGYAVIKLDDTSNWIKAADYNSTFSIHNTYVNPRPKDNIWRSESTRLYSNPWDKDRSTADIGTKDNGIYTIWTSTLFATVLSCNTIDEFKAYIKEHPIIIGYPTANGTHTETLTTQEEVIL